MRNRNRKFATNQTRKNIHKDSKIQQMAEKTIKKDLWYCHWLQEKYPNRFNDDYKLDDLGGDIYDPALFPNRYIDGSND